MLTKKNNDNDNSLFGNKINVSIKDYQLNSNSTNYDPDDEYIIDSERFIHVMELLGFELIESKMFNTYTTNLKLSLTEQDISFLNKTFVFKRIFDVNIKLNQIHIK